VVATSEQIGHGWCVLSSEQRLQFHHDGILEVEAAFAVGQAARMQDVVWAEPSRRYAIERDDPSTWYRHDPTGLKSSKRHGAFAPIFGPVLCEVVDDLSRRRADRRAGRRVFDPPPGDACGCAERHERASNDAQHRRVPHQMRPGAAGGKSVTVNPGY
jgi:hypothetical protein